MDLETTFFNEGHTRGKERGEAIGYEDGMRHGKEEGHQIGFEMGFAHGTAEICKVLFPQDEEIKRVSEYLVQGVEKVDMNRVPAQGDVQRARARFKVLESRIGVNLSSLNRQNDMTF